jgi:hypothetical protein
MKVFQWGFFQSNGECWALAFSLLSVCPLFNLRSHAEVTISRSDFHGRESHVLENERIQLRMLTGGGYIGERRFKSEDPF